jgi:putative toxin-antitoxin system antitoxin component (TIGR02293 family)
MGYTDPMIAAAAISDVLGLSNKVSSLRDLEGAVAAGLPKASLPHLMERLYGDRRAARESVYRVVPEATWKRRSTHLSPEESQRTERIARVLAAAEYGWDSREDARDWMMRPHPELEGKTPFDAAQTELGARRAEEILNALFFGLPG